MCARMILQVITSLARLIRVIDLFLVNGSYTNASLLIGVINYVEMITNKSRTLEGLQCCDISTCNEYN